MFYQHTSSVIQSLSFRGNKNNMVISRVLGIDQLFWTCSNHSTVKIIRHLSISISMYSLLVTLEHVCKFSVPLPVVYFIHINPNFVSWTTCYQSLKHPYPMVGWCRWYWGRVQKLSLFSFAASLLRYLYCNGWSCCPTKGETDGQQIIKFIVTSSCEHTE